MSEDVQVARILCVDDERSVLMSLKRLFRGKRFKVTLANSGQEGLEAIENKEPFDLIISDMRMPNMDGAEFLEKSLSQSPDSVRLLLTGYSDQDATIRAINKGKIFEYINKPWKNEELKKTVVRALNKKSELDKRRKLIAKLQLSNKTLFSKASALNKKAQSTQEELKQTTSFLDFARVELNEAYETTIKVFANIINQRVGNTPKFIEQVITQTCKLADHLELPDERKGNLQNAAMLYALGKFNFSDELLNKTVSEMTPEEKVTYAGYPKLGESVLTPLVALQDVARIISCHKDPLSDEERVHGLEKHSPNIEARILRIVVDFNEFLTKEKTKNIDDAIVMLKNGSTKEYDENLVAMYLEILQNAPALPEFCDSVKSVCELEDGMRVTRDVYSSTDALLISKGTIVSQVLIEKMLSYEVTNEDILSIYVSNEND
ncbi:response regulator [Aliikangiella coralliicola]|uniref:Response regulator n=1 Tax=Aliikangiella coralliicola TaxID=2592383 RepID=A0A545UDU6_9GAMM|nr:response regulator [Aliikangiella coralliicola]TQV87593.1 response regulator [Aliikangiella coralliicola]